VSVQMLTTLFWCLAAACNLSLVYGLYGDVNGYVHLSNTVACLYAAVHRTAWAVGVAWVIFACVTGNGGQFIQHKDQIVYNISHIVLTRLTYSCPVDQLNPPECFRLLTFKHVLTECITFILDIVCCMFIFTLLHFVCKN